SRMSLILAGAEVRARLAPAGSHQRTAFLQLPTGQLVHTGLLMAPPNSRLEFAPDTTGRLPPEARWGDAVLDHRPLREEREQFQRNQNTKAKKSPSSRAEPEVRIHLLPAASLRTKVANNVTVSAI